MVLSSGIWEIPLGWFFQDILLKEISPCFQETISKPIQFQRIKLKLKRFALMLLLLRNMRESWSVKSLEVKMILHLANSGRKRGLDQEVPDQKERLLYLCQTNGKLWMMILMTLIDWMLEPDLGVERRAQKKEEM